MRLAPLVPKPMAQPTPNRRVSRKSQPQGEADDGKALDDGNEAEARLPEDRRADWSEGGIVQARRFSAPARLLAKLEVGEVDDPLEHEADAIADRVMRMPMAEPGPGEFPPLPPRTASVLELRRACCASCSTCDEDEKLRREPAAGQRGGTASKDFASSVHERLRLGGLRLSAPAREFLEPRLGVELGGVWTHADAVAGSLARRVHARAFTLDQHIFFAPGELRPHTEGGMQLLAHEVAHTLQNRSAEPRAVRRSADGAGETATTRPSAKARSLHARLATPVRPREHHEEHAAEEFSRRPSLSALRSAPSRVEPTPDALPTELANPGIPLPDSLRRPLLAAGVDADAVRVHTDDAAARLAGGFHARALTFGDHIAFASGEYRSQHSEGARLLLHETFHALRPAPVFSLDRNIALQQAIHTGQVNPAELDDLSLKDLLWLREEICEKVDDIGRLERIDQQVIQGLINPRINAESSEAPAFSCIAHRRKTLRKDMLAAVRRGQDITRLLHQLSAKEQRLLLREVEKLPQSGAADHASEALRHLLGMGERTSQTITDDDLKTATASAELVGILGPKSPELKRLEANLRAYQKKATALDAKQRQQAALEQSPAGRLLLELQAMENKISLLGVGIKTIRVIQGLVDAWLSANLLPAIHIMLEAEVKSLESEREAARAHVKQIKRWLTKEAPPEEVMRRNGLGPRLDEVRYLKHAEEEAVRKRKDAIASGDAAAIKTAKNELAKLSARRRKLEAELEAQYLDNYESYVRNARKIAKDEAALEELEAKARASMDEADYEAREVLSDRLETTGEAHAEAQAEVERLRGELFDAGLAALDDLWHRPSESKKGKKGKKGKKAKQRGFWEVWEDLSEAKDERDEAKSDLELLEGVDESMRNRDPKESSYESVVSGSCEGDPIELSTRTIVTAQFQLGNYCKLRIHGHRVEREGSLFFVTVRGTRLRIVSDAEKEYIGLIYGGNGTRTGRKYLYMAADILSPYLNTTHDIVVDAAASHLASEGGLSSINTWDGQRLSIAGRSEKMGAVSGLVDAGDQMLDLFATRAKSKQDEARAKQGTLDPALDPHALDQTRGLLMEVRKLVKAIAGTGTVADRFKVDEIAELVYLLEIPSVMLMMAAGFLNDSILRFYGLKTKRVKKGEPERANLFMDMEDANVDVLDAGASPGVVSVAIHNYLGAPGNVPKPANAVKAAQDKFPATNDGSAAYYAQISRQVAFLVREREMATAAKGKRRRDARHFFKWTQKAGDFDSYYKYAQEKTPFNDDAARDVIPGWGSTRQRGHVPRLLDEAPSHGNYLELRNSDDSLKGYVDLGPEPKKREQMLPGDEKLPDGKDGSNAAESRNDEPQSDLLPNVDDF